MSQSYSEVSARDTHQLWLKGSNQHVKRPNVRGQEEEEEEGWCLSQDRERGVHSKFILEEQLCAKTEGDIDTADSYSI